MADCLAGVWAFHSNERYKSLEQGDVEEAINAAQAIGDDRLQTPEPRLRGARLVHARLLGAARALVHDRPQERAGQVLRHVPHEPALTSPLPAVQGEGLARSARRAKRSGGEGRLRTERTRRCPSPGRLRRLGLSRTRERRSPPPSRETCPMPGIDPSRSFVPLAIAVLTVSDTRSLADDRSGDVLAERLTKAGHRLAARAVVAGRRRGHPRQGEGVDRGPRHRRDYHHGRHGLYRTRRDARGDRAPVREAHGRLLGRLSPHLLRQNRHLDDPVAGDRRRRRRDLHLRACRARPAPARTLGTASWRASSTTATGPATSSRSCRASTSICGAASHRTAPRRYRTFFQTRIERPSCPSA